MWPKIRAFLDHRARRTKGEPQASRPRCYAQHESFSTTQAGVIDLTHKMLCRSLAARLQCMQPTRHASAASRPLASPRDRQLSSVENSTDPTPNVPTLDEIKADFDLLDSWEDRYRYVMELGRALPAYPEPLRDEAHKVRGCASQVWLAETVKGRGPSAVLHFEGDSDSHLVRGLVAVLLAGVQDRTAQEILAFDAQAALRDLGLAEHLTPQRSNGFASMVTRVRAAANAAAAA
jgi:cysteine desulfuration protein SufE